MYIILQQDALNIQIIKRNNVLAQIEIIDDAPIKEVLNSLGGWPVITPGWDEKSSSVPKLETLVATLKRKFTLGVLLEEWIGPDDKHSGANVIQVNYKSSLSRLKTLVIFLLNPPWDC